MAKIKFLMDTEVRVTYSANEPHIVNKKGLIKSYPIERCNDYWYDVLIEGKKYHLCSGQLFWANPN